MNIPQGTSVRCANFHFVRLKLNVRNVRENYARLLSRQLGMSVVCWQRVQ